MRYAIYDVKPEHYKKFSTDLFEKIKENGREIARLEPYRWGDNIIYDVNGVTLATKTGGSMKGSHGRTGVVKACISARDDQELNQFIHEFSLEGKVDFVD